MERFCPDFLSIKIPLTNLTIPFSSAGSYLLNNMIELSSYRALTMFFSLIFLPNSRSTSLVILLHS
jgi:hypothetical protein